MTHSNSDNHSSNTRGRERENLRDVWKIQIQRTFYVQKTAKYLPAHRNSESSDTTKKQASHAVHSIQWVRQLNYDAHNFWKEARKETNKGEQRASRKTKRIFETQFCSAQNQKEMKTNAYLRDINTIKSNASIFIGVKRFKDNDFLFFFYSVIKEKSVDSQTF